MLIYVRIQVRRVAFARFASAATAVSVPVATAAAGLPTAVSMAAAGRAADSMAAIELKELSHLRAAHRSDQDAPKR